MPKQLQIALSVVAVPFAMILVISAVFAMDRASNGGEVLGIVAIAGSELGGLDNEEARQTLLDLQEQLSTVPITVTVLPRIEE